MRIEVLKKVEKSLQSESCEIREDLQDILEKLEAGFILGMPHVRPLPSIHIRLYEIRLKDRTGQYRVIYFLKKNDAIYILHSFRKKTQKTPQKEKAIILKRLKEIKL